MPGHLDFVVMVSISMSIRLSISNGIQVAANHHAQVVGDELHDVMIVLQGRVLAEDGLAWGSSTSASIDIRPSLRTFARISNSIASRSM